MQFDLDGVDVEVDSVDIEVAGQTVTCFPDDVDASFEGEIDIDLTSTDLASLREGRSVSATCDELTISIATKAKRPSKETNQEYLDRTWAEDPRRTREELQDHFSRMGR